MSFDSLMTSARKINGSKKSQSLRSEIMCHPTLRFCYCLLNVLIGLAMLTLFLRYGS